MLSEEYIKTLYYFCKLSVSLKLVQNKNFLNAGFIAKVVRHNKEEEDNSETEVKDLNPTFLISNIKAEIQVST